MTNDEIELGTVSYTVSAERLSEFGADFNSEAIDDAVLKELNKALPLGVKVRRNGKAFARGAEAAEAGRNIDWTAMLSRIDLPQIVADN